MTKKNITEGSKEEKQEHSLKMFKLQKKVLKSGNYDEKTFQKELKKSRDWMFESHFKELLDWAMKEFVALADKIKSWFKDIFAKKQVSLA